MSDTPPLPLHIGKPEWLKTKIPTGDVYFQIKRDLRQRKLFTVCEEAKCPNIAQCWSEGTATFMVLGDTCTRACRFCHIKTGNPGGWLDADEPRQTAESAKAMGLKYAVITMVDRDDLADGGAAHVAKVIHEVRALSPQITIEILAGDFQQKITSLQAIVQAKPEVYAHNLETVERLTPRVRDARASYRQSLEVLRLVRAMADYRIYTKSALMLGLGETLDEVVQTLGDLREHGVEFVTLGQYLRPTKQHLSIKRWVPPEEFDELAVKAKAMGFLTVASGPLVRSSYKAASYFAQAIAPR